MGYQYFLSYGAPRAELRYYVLINRAGGLYGRILTEVASTDLTQWGSLAGMLSIALGSFSDSQKFFPAFKSLLVLYWVFFLFLSPQKFLNFDFIFARSFFGRTHIYGGPQGTYACCKLKSCGKLKNLAANKIKSLQIWNSCCKFSKRVAAN